MIPGVTGSNILTTAVILPDPPSGLAVSIQNGAARQESFAGSVLAVGGTGAMAYSISAGALPTGLSINSSTGAITGTVDVTATLGANAFTVRATDPFGQYVEEACSIDVGTIISLMHLNGTNGGTTFTDETGKTWTRVNSITTSTTQQKFGTGSLWPGGASGRRLRLPSASATEFNFGTSDWTIDVWLFASGYGNYAGFGGKRDGGGGAWATHWYDISGSGGSNASLGCEFNFPSGPNIYYNTGSQTGAWYHVAYTCKSGTVRVFRNGVQVATGSLANITGGTTANVTCGAGYDHSDSGYWRGYMQEWRVTKGCARWVENFTPPTGPSDYPA